MTQVIICKKIARYLELTNPVLDPLKHTLVEIDLATRDQPDLSEVKKMITMLKTTGYCFGFSVAYGAMNHIGKTRWWLSLLNTLANWDEDSQSLFTHIQLIDADDEQCPTLDQLFDRALNYIVPNQGARAQMHAEFHIRSIEHQAKCLHANSFLEMVDGENHIQVIKNHKAIAGHFIKSELSIILDEMINHIPDTICLIQSLGHAMHLNRVENTWVLYDPNYNHVHPKKMTRSFCCSQTLVDEIFARLHTDSLRIDISTFNDHVPLFTSYDKLLATKGISILEAGGLAILAQTSPSVIPQLLKPLRTLDKENHNTLLNALCAQSQTGWNGLQMAAWHAPDSLFQMLELLGKLKANECELIIKALSLENEDKCTGFQIVAKCAPNLWPKILDLLTQVNQEMRAHAANSILLQDSQGWNTLHAIAYYTPAMLPDFVAALGQENIHVIAKALHMRNLKGWTGLQIIAHHAPHALPKIFLILQRADHADFLSIAQSMSLQNAQGWTTFHSIISKAPAFFPSFLTMLGRERLPIVAHALEIKTNDGHSLLSMIMTKAPDTLPIILESIAEENALSLALELEEDLTAITRLRNTVSQQTLAIIPALENALKLRDPSLLNTFAELTTELSVLQLQEINELIELKINSMAHPYSSNLFSAAHELQQWQHLLKITHQALAEKMTSCVIL